MKFPKNVVWRPMRGSQEAFLASYPIFEVLFEGTRGGGKEIADDTLVLTDEGWLRADEVTLNHRLVAGDGSYVSLLGIYPQPLKKTYEITFQDGQKIIAGAEHRWKVKSNKNTSRGWVVKNTQHLYNYLTSGWSIPFMSGPHGGKKWEGYDPYVIGLIAGDGTLNKDRRSVILYNSDPQILQYMSDLGWKTQWDDKWSTGRAYPPIEVGREIYMEMWESGKGDMKCIPSKMMSCDAETRLAVLQGLMDADGSVCKREGKPSFCSISEVLAEQVRELTFSLGGKGTVNLKKFSGDRNKWYFQVAVAHQNKFNPFRLDRKRKYIIEQKKQLKRNIKSIKQVDPVPSRCFAVDHPDHTFVIEGYIVTHNTDCLLMSFGMHVGKGFGAGWRGILFRQTYKQLGDVIAKTQKWFPQIWPDAKFNQSDSSWSWPSGEKLLLRQFMKPDDYWNYHGHEYPWIGWEELCNWPNDEGYKRMMSCCRSSTKGMPRMVRATTNPYGPGHNWVKHRFRPVVMNMQVRKDLEDEPARLVIHSHIDENTALLEADPEYKQKIAASARNEAERKAWLEGSWDIVAGGMFDDVWDPKYNIVPEFDIPEQWKIVRSFDWGASKPFSVGWWAISDGSDFQLPSGTWKSSVRGDVFRVKEWYGSTGKPNEGLDLLAVEIAEGIVEREVERGWRSPGTSWCRVKPGVADSQIFAAENGNCIATDMKVKIRLSDGFKYPGITWNPADKRPGSRSTGWTQMRQRLKNAHPNTKLVNDELRIYPRERPGLFITENCQWFAETVPVLPRDDKNMDDVNTDAEDHIADETRYLVRWIQTPSSSGSTTGHY